MGNWRGHVIAAELYCHSRRSNTVSVSERVDTKIVNHECSDDSRRHHFFLYGSGWIDGIAIDDWSLVKEYAFVNKICQIIAQNNHPYKRNSKNL